MPNSHTTISPPTFGTIKKWTEGGWGFIARDDGQPDVFAHVRYFKTITEPRVGMRVWFDVTQDEHTGKMRADNVSVELGARVGDVPA
jgi:cold shock CspA family protein